MQIGKWPRVRLCALPTPLEELHALTKALGGPRILMKRDDLTSLAFGGNKARQMEFIMADAVARGADTVITCGAGQSNHARVTAAAATRLGMKCYVVLGPAVRSEMQGNLLLDRILGAEVHRVATNDIGEQMEIMQAMARDLEGDGHLCHIIPRGGASVPASIAYVNCFLEIIRQANEMGAEFNRLVLATGTTGTQAGVEVAARWTMPAGFQVIGISTGRSVSELRPRLLRHANEAAEALEAPFRFVAEDFILTDEYVGDAYGMLTAGCIEAIKLLARTEAILLDPVYTAKSMAGMIDMIRKGKLTKNDTVVFLHTGGTPALFAYSEDLKEALDL